MKDISYQSFCWALGTTSFRVSQLNLKIEQQLILLDKFRSQVQDWKWNKESQEKYYELMKAEGLLYGDAKLKDKDAREKTSGLVDIGLISKERLVTSAGKELLEIATRGNFRKDKIFNIYDDSYIYLKQLLKTSINVSGNIVRPFIVTIKCLKELDFLTYDEFTYLVPLIKDAKSLEKIIEGIKHYRNEEIKIEDVIYDILISMDNYKLALDILIHNTVDENLICTIGMNRKSKKYDKDYFTLYKSLKEIFIEGSDNFEKLFLNLKKIKHKAGFLWRNLIFQKNGLTIIRKKGKDSLSKNCPFKFSQTEIDFKLTFFKYMHVFKAMSTLLDYFDLNKRYFNLADILIFEDGIIKLDIIPQYYFKEIIDNLCSDAFSICKDLTNNITLEQISSAFKLDINIIFAKLSKDLGISIQTSTQATAYIDDERRKSFDKLIDKKFTDEILLELLDCFEKRDDKRIEELVTSEATIATIFEYIVGIIWYKISEREGNILDFMKLSLEANLLPKTHAVGGAADIIYEYEKCADYPKHSLLIEATLTENTNQRRAEMEPVSRHLGEHMLLSKNSFDYSLFLSTYLDANVITDFRYRKIMPYVRDKDKINGMKIVPLDTSTLKTIIKNNTKYRRLYKIFDLYHNKPIETESWHEDMKNEILEKYTEI